MLAVSVCVIRFDASGMHGEGLERSQLCESEEVG